ncbi:hypothetical protein EOM86_11305 [Candidatus Nomurabacteria bacterium]|nr:hypothetical protein [Candidatus Nomurabacteria bacterium]
MNIAVFPVKSEDFYFKPDNTLVKDGSDYFIPDIIDTLYASAAFVVRINKAVKYTTPDFAGRYYSEVAFGCILNPADIVKTSSPFSSGLELAMDHTAYLTDKYADKTGLSGELSFSFGKKEFRITMSEEYLKIADRAIERVSRYCSLKSGDLIFLELAEMSEIKRGEEISLCYSEALSFNFLIR